MHNPLPARAGDYAFLKNKRGAGKLYRRFPAAAAWRLIHCAQRLTARWAVVFCRRMGAEMERTREGQDPPLQEVRLPSQSPLATAPPEGEPANGECPFLRGTEAPHRRTAREAGPYGECVSGTPGTAFPTGDVRAERRGRRSLRVRLGKRIIT